VVGAATRAAWLVALHDNYDMAVQRSPTFDPADAIGAANRWAGGPHWQIHPARQWRYAERNLDSILAVTRPTAYFIDATTALPLPEASAATPDLTRSGAIDAFRDLARRVSERIGPVGSEDGQEWALGAFDWFEGMLSDSRFGEVGEPWPLFELAHHQDAALFWHQSETLGLPGPRADWARSRSSASDLLELLSFARTPLFTPPPGERWWWQEASSRKASGDDARNPFVRGDGGWGDGRHPLDVLLKNTYEVLSPVSELASALPLVGHEARPDGVVRTVFGDGRADSARRVEVLVNRGTQPLHVPEGELPPGVGFVVRAPTFVAFHATRWRGVDYGSGGALFTVRSLDQAPLERSREVRVWHGFGASTLALGGPEREPRARTIPAEGVVLDPTER
jgi:hypothetical protein